MEEEARSTSQAQEKKDEGSLVSTLNAVITSFLDSNNRTANKRLAPQSQHPPPQF
jgi:hypothetical protein